MEKDRKIQAMNKTQLAQAYNVGMVTLKKWLVPFQKEIGEYRGRTYTPNQVKIIFELLGKP
jgi:hypothetical protein